VPPTATLADAPPALRAPAVVACAAGPGDVVARTASLDAGTLRVTCADGIEVVRPAAWLRAEGDGRDAIDVVLRPCGSAVTITWRDGRRSRFGVAALRTSH
jgi:hypothetical protein